MHSSKVSGPCRTIKSALFLGSLLAACGVLLGAFGAHALADQLESSGHTSTWQTAVDYQFWHALALVLLALLAHSGLVGGKRCLFILLSFSLGILCFSGSLYALSMGGPRLLGPVTPLGGLFFLAGWLTLASFARYPPPSH